MKNSLLIAAGVAALLSGCDQISERLQGASAPAAVADAAPLGKLSSEVVPAAYRLDLAIDPDKERFGGSVEIDVVTAKELSRIWLHGSGLEVTEAYATWGEGERAEATYEQVDVTGVAKFQFDAALPKGRITLHATFSAPFQGSPDAIYRTEEGGAYYAASQLESISARKIFPGFDHIGFKTPFDITITTKTGDVAVTAAPEIASEDLGDGTTRHVFATTEPIATYLLSFSVGPYGVNEWTPIPPNAVRAEPLPLRGLAAGDKSDGMDYALDNTGEMVRILEEYFDTPYPYAKLDLTAAPDFFSGAMENVGNIIYNEFLLIMDEDSAFSQRRFYEFVHAHELAHQWFGNYVTPAWWDDIWLNESFTSWIMYKVADEHWPEGEFSRSALNDGLNTMAADSLVNARQIRNPVETNAEIDDAFDGITYQKGGAVLSMFESYLGEAAFRDGIRTHLKRFAHGTATVDDFMKSMADGSRRPEVIPAFQSFISQPGVPLVETSLDCEGAPKLTFRQSRYAPLGSAIDTNKTWQIPLCAAVGTGDGQASVCGLVDKKEVVLPLETASCPAFVVPNGDGAGYFRFALDRAGWSALAAAAPTLTAAQGLSTADSLDAAFRADAASADALLDGFAALSAHDAWDVVSSVADKYEALIDIAPNAEAKAAIEAYGAELIRPLYDAMDEDSSLLLQSSLTRFMAIVALDPAVRASLIGPARAYIGLGGEADADAVKPDLLQTVLSVGVQDGGDEYFDALLATVRASDDANFRNNAVGALARTEDLAQSAELLGAVLDEAFAATEMNTAIFRQIARPATREHAWAWFKENFDTVLERNGGITAARGVVGIGVSFCTPALKADYEAFMAEHATKIPGYERTLAQTLESIDLCIALSQAKGQELADAAAGRL